MARGSVSVHVWLCSLAVCVGVTVLTRVLRLRAGFTAGGAVLDRKTLRTLGITLGGGITTLITALLTLADTERGGKYDDEVARSCTLSTMQKEVIRIVLGNSTCASNSFEGFNESLASYLV